jgi:uncharacterized protein YecE (DUF72 family)
MGDIRVGTASWTDRTLIESGWYPPEADNPARRLRFYAERFPVVEVDATYYALPAETTAEAWAGRTPAGFTFNIKAFSLFTQHPTRIAALPPDLREGVPDSGKGTVYLRQVAPAVADQAWDRFLSGHDLPYVCVDMPQGYPSSIPPVLAATADLAVVRMHGHSPKWTSKDIHERFGYRYSQDELAGWATGISELAGRAAATHVLFNNCYRDYAQVNARQLADLLEADA